MEMPTQIGTFHIIGVGGIGMSAIAEILIDKGYSVQGSDQKDSANVKRLRARGVRVFIGHDAVNLVGARQVVISSAVKDGNPELDAARKRGLPIIRRAEMLAELMRLYSTISVTGTHGKTSTTSMIAHILTSAGVDPTVIAGGIINDWGTNARLGQGPWMVVEADESDGTFLRLPTQIGVVTNADPEHLDYYGDVATMNAAYETFMQNIPFYGLLIACVDHPVVTGLLKRLDMRRDGRRLFTFGQSPSADIRLTAMSSEGHVTVLDVELSTRATGGEPRRLTGLRLNAPGRHNALNAMAAIGVAIAAGVSDEAIRQALATYSGVKRRFQLTGQWNGVSIYDDYAHHPVEISSALEAARAGAKGRVVAVFEPHRYSRIKSLYPEFCACFKNADSVIVAPLYTAGEIPIKGIDQHSIAEGIRNAGHRSVLAIDDPRDLTGLIHRYGRPGDLVVCLGAGTSTEWANALPIWLSDEPRMAGE